MKLFLSAFEYAWAPFYFATMKEADAKRTFSLVTTYGLAALVLLAAGLAAVSTDVVRLMTKPAFYEAARVIPWIGLGVLFQGVYLLTSIGLNITKQTRYYPVATIAAAVDERGGEPRAGAAVRGAGRGVGQRARLRGAAVVGHAAVATLLPDALRVDAAGPRGRGRA